MCMHYLVPVLVAKRPETLCHGLPLVSYMNVALATTNAIGDAKFQKSRHHYSDCCMVQ